MEGLRRSVVLVAVGLMFAAVMLPEVAVAVRFVVGANMGWTSNVNYSLWAQDKRFYNGDWLFFVYDRSQMNVLEVKKTGYENCISDHPLHNWTTGIGRGVVPLNVTRDFYFISGKGFCLDGMRVAVHVENPPPLPPPPTASSSPLESASS